MIPWHVAYAIQIVIVGVPGNTEPMQNVQAIFIGFGRGMSDITDLKVSYIDSDSKDVNEKLIRDLYDWPCFWAWSDIYDSLWFAFTNEEPKISSTQICIENEQCEDNGQSDAMLISMAVYYKIHDFILINMCAIFVLLHLGEKQ